jgi:hypothetical protein
LPILEPKKKYKFANTKKKRLDSLYNSSDTPENGTCIFWTCIGLELFSRAKGGMAKMLSDVTAAAAAAAEVVVVRVARWVA